jgi:hypothetical protein
MDFTPVRSYISSALQPLHRAKPTSSYQYGQALFWTAVGTVAVAGICVILIETGYSIGLLNPLIQAPANDFFGSSLTLILNIISLVFIVVIFLVQNANQAYSTRLSGVILRDRYFLATIGFVLAGSIFSISGSYLDLGAPYTLVGYAFSVATVLLVGALIAFAGYFINISNIIEYITRQIENDITAGRIYKPNPFGLPLQDEEYIARLNNRTQLIVSTCIKAIEQNQQPVVDSCLDSLERITNQFLEETTELDVDEDFLQELNDQFQFISTAAFEDYSRQKHSERVAETIGDIGVAITKSREVGSQGGLWAKLLEQIFTDSLEFDRTTAASISIRKLGEMSITAINRGDSDSVRIYQSSLENISTICATGNHPYLAGLLQTLHGQYQDMYAAYLNALLVEGYVFDYDVQVLFEDFAESFNQAKTNYDRYNTQIAHTGVFEVEPFAGTIAVPLLQHEEVDPRTQPHLQEYLEELVDFLRNVGVANIEANQPEVYKGYTQFLFTFEQTEPLETDANRELITQLNDVWLELVAKTYETANESEENVDHHLNKQMGDFTALLIYFHREEPELLADLIEPLAETYRNQRDTYDRSNSHVDHNLTSFYKQLKLVGAWINRFHDPQTVTPQLWNILVDDFYKIPEINSKIPRRLMPKYGYPSTNRSYQDTWRPQHNMIWQTEFQEEIAATLNGEDGSNYVEFHERLEGEQ